MTKRAKRFNIPFISVMKGVVKMKFREKMQQFMYGRYGNDQLSRVYLVITLVLLGLSLLTRWTIFYIAGIALLIYCYYRMFSKSIAKMSAQNQKYLNWRYGLAVKRQKAKTHMEQRKIYHFYKCPQCSQKVRVPKGHGKICITCPKCKMEFVRKS